MPYVLGFFFPKRIGSDIMLSVYAGCSLLLNKLIETSFTSIPFFFLFLWLYGYLQNNGSGYNDTDMFKSFIRWFPHPYQKYCLHPINYLTILYMFVNMINFACSSCWKSKFELIRAPYFQPSLPKRTHHDNDPNAKWGLRK